MSGSTQYVYDESGQLIKEINGTDYTEYAYDSKGNISTRKAYSNNSLVSTDNFTYGAETWEDRLTGYNGKTIAYDSIGNPTSYLGATITWRGRELESYTKGNIQILYSYDVDGMRYQKIVKTDGVETARYDYVYSEGTLVLITYTADGVSDTARFIYDSYGEPRGFILNNTAAYLYLKNAQGDITGIVNENGEVILTCTYDAWGNVNFGSTSMTHMTLAAKLSQINPFTYRGYCYDYDIGMYYLQSRYYDPKICRFINADSTDYLGATGTLLSYNLFAYCENDGVNRVDPKGSEYVYVDLLYREIDKNSYFVNTKLRTINKNGYTKSSSTIFFIFKNNLISISTKLPGIRNIINKNWLNCLAAGILVGTRRLFPNSLKGRSLTGIQFELLVHYIFYIALKDLKPKTDEEIKDLKRFIVIDIGATTGNIGYDSNAYAFEKYKYLYPVFETKLFSGKYTAYALYKALKKLGVF